MRSKLAVDQFFIPIFIEGMYIMYKILFFSFLLMNYALFGILDSEKRPWGHYEIISEDHQYKVKKIVVNPQKRLSLQRHKYRAEYWIIISGTGLVTHNDKQIQVEKGSNIIIKEGDVHRVENIGDVDLIFIEVQTGSYFGEDDIERLSDDYGRVAEQAKTSDPKF